MAKQSAWIVTGALAIVAVGATVAASQEFSDSDELGPAVSVTVPETALPSDPTVDTTVDPTAPPTPTQSPSPEPSPSESPSAVPSDPPARESVGIVVPSSVSTVSAVTAVSVASPVSAQSPQSADSSD